MIELVAQSLFDRHCQRCKARGTEPHHPAGTLVRDMPPSYRDDYIADARAAIEAMREPTPQMVAAVAPLALTAAALDCYDIAAKAVALLPQNQHPDLPDVLATMVQDHRAMIDAALSEQEG
jgi:hypothetical protein